MSTDDHNQKVNLLMNDLKFYSTMRADLRSQMAHACSDIQRQTVSTGLCYVTDKEEECMSALKQLEVTNSIPAISGLNVLFISTGQPAYRVVDVAGSLELQYRVSAQDSKNQGNWVTISGLHKAS